MSRSALVVFGILALLGIGITSLVTLAQPPKEATRREAFSTMPVLVNVKAGGSNRTLERAEIRNLGGRQFVVGVELKGSTYTRERFGGGTVWIPIDEVTELIELRDVKSGK